MKQSQRRFWCMIISIMLIASMFGMFSINAAATSTNKVEIGDTNVQLIWGDVSLNQKVELKDATMIQEHLAKIITLSGDAYLCGCVDQKSTLDIKDVTIIQEYLAKIHIDNTYVGQVLVQPTVPSTEAPTVLPTEATDAPTQSPTLAPNYVTVYFDNSNSQWSSVNFYYWGPNTTGSVIPMTLSPDSTDVYQLQVDANAVTGFLFKDTDDTVTWNLQSVNLTVPTNAINCYKPASNVNKPDGSWVMFFPTTDKDSPTIATTDDPTLIP
ncbi:MAG: dockerin type I repeat-containing protein [Bacillota bacterium]|nr:dockerin type I repeat-containing protein [Bacillota bacterium]